MTPDQILDIGQSTIYTLLWVTGPLMMVALLVGLIIALFQALTSIQEMTLTFVPKIIVVFVALGIFLPFMAGKLSNLATQVFQHIASSGL